MILEENVPPPPISPSHTLLPFSSPDKVYQIACTPVPEIYIYIYVYINIAVPETYPALQGQEEELYH